MAFERMKFGKPGGFGDSINVQSPQITLPRASTTQPIAPPQQGVVRGTSTDTGFTDGVVENLGLPIVSGGGYSDNALIQAGEAMSPVTTTNSGERVSNSGGQTVFLPKPSIPVISGCMDSGATNYNPRATVNKASSCIYPTKPTIPLSESRNISVTITSDKPANIFINGSDTSQQPSKTFNYTGKELLTPKFFKVGRDGFKSNDEYKLYSVKKKFSKTVAPIVTFDDDFIDFDENPFLTPISETLNNPYGFNPNSTQGVVRGMSTDRGFTDEVVGTYTIAGKRGLGISAPVIPPKPRKPRPISVIEYDYYEFKLEKNGKEIPLLNQINKITDTINKVQVASLPFNLTKDIVVEEPVKTPYDISIESFTGADDIIKYQTSWGTSGFLEDDDEIDISYISQEFGEKPSITFSSPSISDFTHTVVYSYDTPSSRHRKSFKTKDLTIDLESGKTNILVDVTAVPVESAPDAPTIKANLTRVKFNIAADDSVKIPYTSINSEKVTYTLGKTVRQIDLSGSLVLKNSDFYNGVGNYTIYLQPSSKRGGSGNIETISVTVESRENLPGPDITNVNYPQNIKGADFKGYNVPFDISWQSINTNYVNIYAGKKTSKTSLGQFPSAGLATFNVDDVLKKLKIGNLQKVDNRDITQFTLVLIPTNIEGNESTEGKYEEINITFDKGDLTIRRGTVISDIKKAFAQEFDSSLFDETISPFLTHYLHLGEGNNKLVATWGIDDDTLSTFEDNVEDNTRKKTKEVKSLVLKLYEPLAPNVNPNDKIWLSKLQAIPLIDQITLINDISKDCIPLTPNFALETNDVIGYQILDDLITSGSSTSTDIVNQFISSSEFSLDNLDINFVTSSKMLVESNDGGNYYEEKDDYDYHWDGFVKYSSASERVANFFYKVKLIESFSNKYNGLVSGSSVDFGSGTSSQITGSVTSSVSIQNEAKRTLSKINDTKKGFDAFEKFLYTSSSNSNLTYPGAGGNALSASNSMEVSSWYTGIWASSVSFDRDNSSRFVNNLPNHIKESQENAEFALFFDMVGQHFDVLYTHISAINKTKNSEHKFDKGINSDLVYHMLESLGWNADLGSQSQSLWEYAFGKNSDGSTASTMSGKDRQQEIWRRLLNNLPYLYKHKGTKRAIHAALSCYGIPQSLLTVMEFGGPQDVQSAAKTKFTFEDRTFSLNVSGSNSIILPWKQVDGTSSYPDSFEIRLNTEIKQDQQIVSGSGWNVNIDYPESGSLAQLTLNVLSGSQYVSASTNQLGFFNDEYSQIVVNRETGSTLDTISVHIKEGFQERIRTEASASLQVPTLNNGWESGSELVIGGTTLTGSIDEVRLWSAPLSESVIVNHTLLPDAINGNHISSSTEDLLLRLDFEYPKDRSSSGDTKLKNVSVITTYETFATASGFLTENSYPYQYKSYDRDVTAEVPSSGFNVGNKVRFETQTLKSDLNYRTRVSKKSFDQAPLDTDKLGLFFSPIKEINMDIMKSLGGFNIDDYIGDPSDNYKSEYTQLKELRKYYFTRFDLNLSEYIQLVRYIDKSLFDVLESLVPARAKVSSGLLIEPHILERSKVELRPTSADLNAYESSIDTQSDISLKSTKNDYSGIVTASQHTILSSSIHHYEASISSSDPSLLGYNDTYSSTIDASADINQYGFITVNSGSDMGGIVINIDTRVTGSVQGAYDSTAYQQVGGQPDSLGVAGFGLYGSNGNAIRTRLDKNNNFVKDRVKVYLLKEQYSEDVPENIDSNDESLGRVFVSQTKHRFKVNILPFTGSDGNETSSSIGGDIVEVTPLNGLFETHYSNVGDLTSGMENSFFNGSVQTSKTTLDGGSPVQTFTTNPNTLRVSDSGRGSGEPILEVD